MSVRVPGCHVIARYVVFPRDSYRKNPLSTSLQWMAGWNAFFTFVRLTFHGISIAYVASVENDTMSSTNGFVRGIPVLNLTRFREGTGHNVGNSD